LKFPLSIYKAHPIYLVPLLQNQSYGSPTAFPTKLESRTPAKDVLGQARKQQSRTDGGMRKLRALIKQGRAALSIFASPFLIVFLLRSRVLFYFLESIRRRFSKVQKNRKKFKKWYAGGRVNDCRLAI
jgi:hypothetical protein